MPRLFVDEPVKEVEWSNVRDTGFSADGTTLVTFADTDHGGQLFKRWMVENGKLQETVSNSDTDRTQILLSLVPDLLKRLVIQTNDRRYYLQPNSNGRLDIFEAGSGEVLASMVVFGEDDWAAVTPDGHFDTNKLEKPEGLNWFFPTPR